jgi:hypothetical protein
LGEFLPVQVAVGYDVLFVVPGGDAGGLHHGAHGAAMVGSVEQELLDEGRVASNKATAHAGHVAAFGQTGQRDQVLEIEAPQFGRSLHAAQRWLVAKVDLAVALVRGNDKAVAIAQLKELLPLRQRHDGASRVAR